MKKNQKRLKDKINKNQLYIAIGVFLMLFSVIGMVNYTVVAQFFTYCIAFLFGTIGAYFVYLLIFLYGLSLAISKKTRIKMSFVVGGLFLILLGVLIIFANSTFSNEASYLTFNGIMINGNQGDFNFVDCFKESFASFPSIDYTKNVGLIGLLLVCIINSTMSNIGSYCFGGVFISLGTVFILLKYVVKFGRYLKSYVNLLNKKQKMQVYKDAKDIEVDDKKAVEVKKEEKSVENNDEIIEKTLYINTNIVSTNESEIKETQPISNEINEDKTQKFYSDIPNTNGLQKATFEFDDELSDSPFNDAVINSVNEKNEEIKEEETLPIRENHNEEYEENIKTETLKEDIEVNDNKEPELKISTYNPYIRSNYDEDSGTPSSYEALNEDQIGKEEQNVEQKTTLSSQSVLTRMDIKKEESKVERKGDNMFAPRVTNADKRRKNPYSYPPNNLLVTRDTSMNTSENCAVNNERTIIINEFFKNFNIGAKVEGYDIGPSITRFNISTDKNVSVRGFDSKMEDLSKQLKGEKCRFVSVVKGKTTSGIEVSNAKTNVVSFKEVMEDLPAINNGKYTGLCVAFGKDINGKLIYADFQKLTHLLVTGTSGSGKSVFLQAMMISLLMRNSPDELKFVIVDPKQVEFSKYHDLPHLLCPIITEADQALNVLNKLIDEMTYRYSLMKDREFNDIKDYNNEYCIPNNIPTMPYIMVVLDEYGDLVDNCAPISRAVLTLAAKARACGIHLVIATQSPRTNIISGTIKNNFTTRVALLCAGINDSINVVDSGGAEKLAGNGDMLLKCPLFANDGLIRLQGAFIDNKEIKNVIEYIRNRYPQEYDENFQQCLISKETQIDEESQEERREKANDDLYKEVEKAAMEYEYFSISKITRMFGVGFNKASRLFEQLVENGVVEKPVGSSNSKGSKVLKK